MSSLLMIAHATNTHTKHVYTLSQHSKTAVSVVVVFFSQEFGSHTLNTNKYNQTHTKKGSTHAANSMRTRSRARARLNESHLICAPACVCVISSRIIKSVRACVRALLHIMRLLERAFVAEPEPTEMYAHKHAHWPVYLLRFFRHNSTAATFTRWKRACARRY